MSKRKKKPSPASIHKLDRAHHKNEFFRKLKQIITLVSDVKVYSLIPAEELDYIYFTRFRTTRIRAAEGEDIPASIIRDSKYFLSGMLKIHRVPISENGIEISGDDYFTVALTLSLYLSGLEMDVYANAPLVKNALKPYLDFFESDEGYDKAFEKQFGLMMFIGMMESNLNSKIYILKHETRVKIDGKLTMCFCLEMYSKETERIQIELDGVNRPALRVGWGISEPVAKLDWVTIAAKDLDLEHSIKGLRFDIYIQSHALDRLAERLDCIMPGLLHMSISDSLYQPKIIKNKNGRFLFEYRIYDSKAGYLVGELYEGLIIIRTFLFLTNSGTPEGERLMESTGLLKEDKKFLVIDKLSTFIKSDIAANERVKEIFVKAGCGSLFEMDGIAINKPEDIKGKSVSALIANYLGMDDPSGLPIV